MLSKLKVLVRLDVTREIGTGHFRRIENLETIRGDWEFVYYVYTDDRENRIFDNHTVRFLKDEEKKLDFLIDESVSFDVIILDFLKYESGSISSLKAGSSSHIVSFHEYDDYDFNSDLIINYNLFNGWRSYIDKKKFLTGPEYIIFNQEIKKYDRAYEPENIVFVSFGGSDPQNYTEAFIVKVARELTNKKFVIHLGLFNSKDSIMKTGDHLGNLTFVRSPLDLFHYLSRSKKIVCSGGNTMYEVSYFGSTPIVLPQNEHQYEFAYNLEEEGGCYCVGDGNKINWDQVIDRIKSPISKPKMTLIDDLGAKRISERMFSLVNN